MFTGLIQEVGEVVAVDRDADGAKFRITSPIARLLERGDSISVSGVCLTATEIGVYAFEAEAMNQTLSLTTLGQLEQGSRVNLEPALRAGDRLGGHIVQGHVDGVGEIVDRTQDGIAIRLRIAIPDSLRRYVAEHGSLTVDGVSLTVAALNPEGCEVSLIPETLEHTTLGEATVGSVVNIEVDVLARYVERALRGHVGVNRDNAPDEQ